MSPLSCSVGLVKVAPSRRRRTAPLLRGIRMPIVTVKWGEGRSREQKAALADAITHAVQVHGDAEPEQTHVIFEDVRWSDWAVASQLQG